MSTSGEFQRALSLERPFLIGVQDPEHGDVTESDEELAHADRVTFHEGPDRL